MDYYNPNNQRDPLLNQSNAQGAFGSSTHPPDSNISENDFRQTSDTDNNPFQQDNHETHHQAINPDLSYDGIQKPYRESYSQDADWERAERGQGQVVRDPGSGGSRLSENFKNPFVLGPQIESNTAYNETTPRSENMATHLGTSVGQQQQSNQNTRNLTSQQSPEQQQAFSRDHGVVQHPHQDVDSRDLTSQQTPEQRRAFCRDYGITQPQQNADSRDPTSQHPTSQQSPEQWRAFCRDYGITQPQQNANSRDPTSQQSSEQQQAFSRDHSVAQQPFQDVKSRDPTSEQSSEQQQAFSRDYGVPNIDSIGNGTESIEQSSLHEQQSYQNAHHHRLMPGAYETVDSFSIQDSDWNPSRWQDKLNEPLTATPSDLDYDELQSTMPPTSHVGGSSGLLDRYQQSSQSGQHYQPGQSGPNPSIEGYKSQNRNSPSHALPLSQQFEPESRPGGDREWNGDLDQSLESGPRVSADESLGLTSPPPLPPRDPAHADEGSELTLPPPLLPREQADVTSMPPLPPRAINDDPPPPGAYQDVAQEIDRMHDQRHRQSGMPNQQPSNLDNSNLYGVSGLTISKDLFGGDTLGNGDTTAGKEHSLPSHTPGNQDISLERGADHYNEKPISPTIPNPIASVQHPEHPGGTTEHTEPSQRPSESYDDLSSSKPIGPNSRTLGKEDLQQKTVHPTTVSSKHDSSQPASQPSGHLDSAAHHHDTDNEPKSPKSPVDSTPSTTPRNLANPTSGHGAAHDPNRPNYSLGIGKRLKGQIKYSIGKLLGDGELKNEGVQEKLGEGEQPKRTG